MDDAGGYEQYAFVADLYDCVVPYRDRPDVAFFVDAAKDTGSPVLEVGCGTGRVLIPSARAGIDVVGLDSSPHMLAVCRERLQRESPAVQSRVQLVQADMRAFDLARLFTLATLPCRPFQHHVELIYYVTHPDGHEERLVHAFPMRYLFRFEVEHLLARCGFEVEQLYAGFDRSAYGSRYPSSMPSEAHVLRVACDQV